LRIMGKGAAGRRIRVYKARIQQSTRHNTNETLVQRRFSSGA